jgi:hypothetical protein
MRRYFSKGSKNVIGPKDINKNGQIESWEKARAKGMAKGMGKEYVDRAEAKKGGSMYHTTKDGRKARKGLWYNIMMKRKRGAKMRKKGEKGAPTAAAIKKSQGK